MTALPAVRVSATRGAWYPGRCHVIAVIIAMAVSSSAIAADLVGLWDFQGDLSSSVGGPAMIATGWSPTYGTQTIAGQDAQVLEVPALTAAQSLAFANPVGANGGGINTNDFSIGWDLNLRNANVFESLLQTDPASDVDVFTANGSLFPGGGAVSVGAWHRLIMTSTNVSPGNNQLRFYLDGTLLSGVGSTTDDRFSLRPLALIFSDDNGETGDAYLSSFAFWNGALTGGEVAALGGPVAGGFAAVPEPSTSGGAVVALLLILALARRRVVMRLAALVAFLAVGTGAFAGTLITNLNNGPTPSGSFVGSDVLRAEGFTIAEGFSFELESVTAILTAGGTGFVVQIYDDVAGQPSAPLVNLSTSDTINMTITPHTFAPDVPLTLEGNRTYWLVIKGTTPFDTSTSAWWEMPGAGHTTAPGVSFAGSRYTFNSGGAWNAFTATNGLSFEVSAVPEPAAAFLLVGGGLALLLRPRRPVRR